MGGKKEKYQYIQFFHGALQLLHDVATSTDQLHQSLEVIYFLGKWNQPVTAQQQDFEVRQRTEARR